MKLSRSALSLFAVLFLARCGAHAESASPALQLRDEAVRPALRFERAVRVREGSTWEAPASTRIDGLGAGEVTANQRVRVVRVVVQPGDRVEAGALIAEVEAPELVRSLAGRAAANTRLAPLRAWRAELSAQRTAGLARSTDLRELESRVADAEAEARRADAEVRASGVSSSDLDFLSRTGRLPLRAPIAGVVRTVRAIPGRIAEPGQGPLAELVGQRPVRIEVRLHHPWPEGASLVFVPFNGTAIPLDATPLSEAIEPETGARIVWLRPRTETMLAAGTSGRVQVAGFAGDVVEVPLRALLRSQGHARVFRRTPTGTEPVEVQVLSLSGTSALVRGLAPDTEIVADAAQVTPHPEA